MIFLNSNPWGTPPKDGGNKNGGATGGMNDIEQLLEAAQRRFGGGNNGGGGYRGGGGRTSGGNPFAGNGKFIFAALVALWIGSGLYRVEPEENAVLLTFGKWTDTRTESGLGYHLPWPVQEARKVNVAFDRRIEIGFRDGGSTHSTNGLSSESMMLTGDENIIDINFVVLWRINDAGNYMFRIRDPESTIRKVAESAMREIVGRTPIQKAMTESRGQIETQTRELMQKILDEYESGIAINNVQLLRVDPPAPVVDAFDDVQRARTDMERLKNEAQTYKNDIVPRARGEAQRMLQEAEAYKKAVISKAEGEAARFDSIYKAYAEAKDVTLKRLYLDTLQQVLGQSRKIVTSDAKQGPLLPYLPLEAAKPATTDTKKQ